MDAAIEPSQTNLRGSNFAASAPSNENSVMYWFTAAMFVPSLGADAYTKLAARTLPAPVNVLHDDARRAGDVISKMPAQEPRVEIIAAAGAEATTTLIVLSL